MTDARFSQGRIRPNDLAGLRRHSTDNLISLSPKKRTLERCSSANTPTRILERNNSTQSQKESYAVGGSLPSSPHKASPDRSVWHYGDGPLKKATVVATMEREKDESSPLRKSSSSKMSRASSSTAIPTESGEGSPESSSREKETKESTEQNTVEKKRSASVGPCKSYLERLAKPKLPKESQLPSFEPPIEKPKPPRNIRPSILVRVRPINMDESMEVFFVDPSVAPIFKYAGSQETVRKAFASKSEVDFSLFGLSKRILDLVDAEYDGPDAFMAKTFGGPKVPSAEVIQRVKNYIADLNLLDKVEIVTHSGMLSAATVSKHAPGKKYIVSLTEQPISEPMVESICDHEIGTHLLRMLNDEHQTWHGCRERYGLRDPWVSEEGLATINTYRSIKANKIMYPQALKYYAVCRGAELGFCELFAELKRYVPDMTRRFRMCVRVKRGMVDTSFPGAFNVNQAYFKGAVDILQNLDSIDLSKLYAGQIAMEDLDKVHNLIRKEVLRLPRFLESADGCRKFMAHCQQMIQQNMLERNPRSKSLLVRTARSIVNEKSRGVTRPRDLPVARPTNFPSLSLDRVNHLSKPKRRRSPRVSKPVAKQKKIEVAVCSLSLNV